MFGTGTQKLAPLPQPLNVQINLREKVQANVLKQVFPHLVPGYFQQACAQLFGAPCNDNNTVDSFLSTLPEDKLQQNFVRLATTGLQKLMDNQVQEFPPEVTQNRLNFTVTPTPPLYTVELSKGMNPIPLTPDERCLNYLFLLFCIPSHLHYIRLYNGLISTVLNNIDDLFHNKMLSNLSNDRLVQTNNLTRLLLPLSNFCRQNFEKNLQQTEPRIFQLLDTLSPGGVFRLVTDIQNYYNVLQNLLSHCNKVYTTFHVVSEYFILLKTSERNNPMSFQVLLTKKLLSCGAVLIQEYFNTKKPKPEQAIDFCNNYFVNYKMCIMLLNEKSKLNKYIQSTKNSFNEQLSVEIIEKLNRLEVNLQQQVYDCQAGMVLTREIVQQVAEYYYLTSAFQPQVTAKTFRALEDMENLLNAVCKTVLSPNAAEQAAGSAALTGQTTLAAQQTWSQFAGTQAVKGIFKVGAGLGFVGSAAKGQLGNLSTGTKLFIQSGFNTALELYKQNAKSVEEKLFMEKYQNLINQNNPGTNAEKTQLLIIALIQTKKNECLDLLKPYYDALGSLQITKQEALTVPYYYQNEAIINNSFPDAKDWHVVVRILLLLQQSPESNESKNIMAGIFQQLSAVNPQLQTLANDSNNVAQSANQVVAASTGLVAASAPGTASAPGAGLMSTLASLSNNLTGWLSKPSAAGQPGAAFTPTIPMPQPGKPIQVAGPSGALTISVPTPAAPAAAAIAAASPGQTPLTFGSVTTGPSAAAAPPSQTPLTFGAGPAATATSAAAAPPSQTAFAFNPVTAGPRIPRPLGQLQALQPPAATSQPGWTVTPSGSFGTGGNTSGASPGSTAAAASPSQSVWNTAVPGSTAAAASLSQSVWNTAVPGSTAVAAAAAAAAAPASAPLFVPPQTSGLVAAVAAVAPGTVAAMVHVKEQKIEFESKVQFDESKKIDVPLLGVQTFSAARLNNNRGQGDEPVKCERSNRPVKINSATYFQDDLGCEAFLQKINSMRKGQKSIGVLKKPVSWLDEARCKVQATALANFYFAQNLTLQNVLLNAFVLKPDTEEDQTLRLAVIRNCELFQDAHIQSLRNLQMPNVSIQEQLQILVSIVQCDIVLLDFSLMSSAAKPRQLTVYRTEGYPLIPPYYCLKYSDKVLGLVIFDPIH